MSQIAIIGAGIAGLTAALTLQDAGLACTIYEASDRIGGRIHSDTLTWEDGMVSEWCGEFIDAEHATMHQLIKRFGLRTVELGGGRRDRTHSVLYFGHRYYRAEELAERLADRFGAKLALVVGPAITAIGIALFAVPTIGGVYWVTFFPAVLVLGFGMALNTAPMTAVVMGSVEQRHAGIASAINNAVARVGSLLAIAVLGIVLTVVFKSSLDAQLAHLSLSPGLRYLVDAQSAKLAGIQVPAGINNQVQAFLRLAVDEAFVSGFRLVALVCAGLALAGALCEWVMIEEKPFRRASRTPAGEAAVQENGVSVSMAHGGIPGSPG